MSVVNVRFLLCMMIVFILGVWGSGCADTPADTPAGSTGYSDDDESNGEDETSYITSYDVKEIIWVPIPGGTFDMGSEDGDDNELPVHSVEMPDFEMTKTEITVRQYGECIIAGGCSEPLDDAVYFYGNNWYDPWSAENPMAFINWKQAVAFCDWAGGRLPSEAEWEYAARSGGKDNTYPWGDDEASCQYAIMYDESGIGCGRDDYTNVCTRMEGNTEQGLCDMAGNVYEMCQDYYHDSYDGAPTDGSAWEDIEGSNKSRVLRGGGENSFPVYIRTTNRWSIDPTFQSRNAGFRCVR